MYKAIIISFLFLNFTLIQANSILNFKSWAGKELCNHEHLILESMSYNTLRIKVDYLNYFGTVTATQSFPYGGLHQIEGGMVVGADLIKLKVRDKTPTLEKCVVKAVHISLKAPTRHNSDKKSPRKNIQTVKDMINLPQLVCTRGSYIKVKAPKAIRTFFKDKIRVSCQAYSIPSSKSK